MFRSIRVRLIASYLLVVLLAMGIAAGLSWSILDRAFLDVLRQNALAQAQRVAQTIEAGNTDTPDVPETEGSPAAADGGPSDAVASTVGPVEQVHASEGISATSQASYPQMGQTYALISPANNVVQFEADASQFADLTYGYEAQVIDNESVVILNPVASDASAVEATSSNTDSTEARVPPAGYSQALNITDGYHTYIISGDATLAADSAAAAAVASEPPSWLSLTRYDRFRANYAPYSADTQKDGTTSDLLGRPEVQSALAGTPATAVRTYEWAPTRRVLYAAYPVRARDGNVASLAYVASPLPRLSLALLPDYFGPQVLGGAIVAISLAGLAGLMLARVITRPLSQLTEATSSLALGEPASPVPPFSTTELNRLSHAFNTMNTNLTAAYSALASQAQQREAILESLANAVLAADASGEIILTNPAATSLLETAPQPLQEAIQYTLTCGESHATEITARDRVIELLTTPLRDKDGRIDGAVAVGHDVTAYRQLDRLRTDFVSDVSHELRTPLTAIKGFVETLQNGAADDPQVRTRFLETIATETERLTRLTNDLLLLTRADAGRLDLRLASIDLAACAERAAAQLASRAQEKQIAVTVEPPRAPASVQADADRIYQVTINLIENAIKFTPPGGQITISFVKTDGQIACTVADTGPGIPADEIPHLFERFYRGDRSRARPEGAGGAGLGLAIAKAIVEAHGGRIWATSQPGQGSEFCFVLPDIDRS